METVTLAWSCGVAVFYFLSKAALSKSIPAMIASVRDDRILSAHSWILDASSSETRIVSFPVLECSPFGGRPVLGDILHHLTFGRAYILYYARPKVKRQIKNFSPQVGKGRFQELRRLIRRSLLYTASAMFSTFHRPPPCASGRWQRFWAPCLLG